MILTGYSDRIARGLVDRRLARSTVAPAPAKWTRGMNLFADRPAQLRYDETAARAALGTNLATFVVDRSDPLYATAPGCGVHRSEELARFVRPMRSGDYNQFWLLGRSLPFDLGIVDDEVAARVIQGDGLLIMGGLPTLALVVRRRCGPLDGTTIGIRANRPRRQPGIRPELMTGDFLRPVTRNHR